MRLSWQMIIPNTPPATKYSYTPENVYRKL